MSINAKMNLSVILWMSGALVSLSSIAIGARELAGEITTFQMLFFRSVIGLIVVSLIIFSANKQHCFKTKRLKLHIVRNIFHFIGQYGWFVGLGLLPLAYVFALEFTVPMWTLIIAAIFLQEGITLRKVLAVCLGVVGVLVILRPGIAIINNASFIVLFAAIGYSIAHVSVKSLSNTENPLTILFYMCLIQLPIGFAFTVNDWVFPTIAQWFWLLVIGLTALTAHFCITKAMTLADAGVVVTLDFLRLPLIAVIGVIFYEEAFDVAVVFGAVLMLSGNLINLRTGSAIQVGSAKHQD